jgi:hypothetical protein
MKKYKFKIDNKMSHLGEVDVETKSADRNLIKINKRHPDHKDPKELASTIKHEKLHVDHPKMTEKQAYKRSRKTKIGQNEANKLLRELHEKSKNK